MKPYLGLVLLGLCAVSCSQSEENGHDLGTMNQDLGAQADQSVPDAAVVVKTMLNLVAGGLGGFGNVDGSGSAARFYFPAGVAVDGAGNLYVADRSNHTIRKVVLASGAVTTLAGMAGMAGSMDGTGSAARFNFPTGVTADGAGNGSSKFAGPSVAVL